MKDKFEIPELITPLNIPKTPIIITIQGENIDKVMSVEVSINFKED